MLWSGLKHLGSHEYANVPSVAFVDWTTNGRDASEELGAVCLMFGAFNHGFPRRCLVRRHRQLVAFEQQQLADFFQGSCRNHLDSSDKSTLNMSCSSRCKEGSHSVVGFSPVTHHRCQATPTEVSCLSPVLPTLCARLTPSQLM